MAWTIIMVAQNSKIAGWKLHGDSTFYLGIFSALCIRRMEHLPKEGVDMR